MKNNQIKKKKTKNVVLEAKNICKSYITNEKGKNVFENFNLRLEEGEFLAIRGRAGSGKSTMIHLLGALERCDSGEILFHGKDITKYDDLELSHHRNSKVGFVFQKPYGEKYLNVLENVKIPLMLSGCSEEEVTDKAEQVIEMVGLKDKQLQFYKELNEVDMQRMCIARAIVNKPAVLFADEPTFHLEEKAAQSILELFHKIHKNQMTIVLASRDTIKNSERTIKI